jgi:hypothetical protein
MRLAASNEKLWRRSLLQHDSLVNKDPRYPERNLLKLP